MDNALDYGSSDCRFESCHARIFLFFCINFIQFLTKFQYEIFIEVFILLKEVK